jgi:predicted enzyme related to lactoylglutathione lyase
MHFCPKNHQTSTSLSTNTTSTHSKLNLTYATMTSMAETPSQLYGTICWYEIPVTDVSRASAFYSAVLGWSCNSPEGTPAPGGYAKSVHMFNKGTGPGSLNGAFLLVHEGKGVANVTEMGPDRQGVPITTYVVESIEETVKKIETAGGKVQMSVNTYGPP